MNYLENDSNFFTDETDNSKKVIEGTESDEGIGKLVGQSSNRDRVNCRQFVALRPSLRSRELRTVRSVIDHGEHRSVADRNLVRFHRRVQDLYTRHSRNCACIQ